MRRASWRGILLLVVLQCSRQMFGADAPAPKGLDLSEYKTVQTAQGVQLPRGGAGIAGQAGYLGVQVEPGDSAKLAVTAVEPDSPAARCGLLIGDIVISADGVAVSTPDGLRQAIQSRSAGEAMSLAIQRGGQSIELKAALAAVSRPMKLTGERAFLGIRVAELRDQSGVRIEQIEFNSPAQRAGIHVGDMLLKIGETTINAAGRMQDSLADKRPGQNVPISVRREGQELDLHAELVAEPANFGGRRRGFGPPSIIAATPAGYWKKPVIRLAIIGIEFDDAKRNDSISSGFWVEEFFSSKTYTGRSATRQPVFGSVNDYFTEQSYGTLHVEGKWIGWVPASKKRAEYAPGSDNGRHPLLIEALDKLDNDAAQVLRGCDAAVFVYAGSRVQTNRGSVLYPHSGFTLYRSARMPYVVIPEGDTRMTNISVICKELGHVLGLPDLAARPENPGSEGLGIFCGMANVVANGRPQHYSAWCKEQLGWITPKIIDPTVKQKLILSPIEDSPRECFKVLVRRDGSEYLLLENRQRKGFDASLPGDGLLIWRVVDGHPSLEPAHGITGPAASRVYLSAIPFPSAANSRFTPQTTPSSRSQLGGGLPVYITDIRRLDDGRITFAIGYDVE